MIGFGRDGSSQRNFYLILLTFGAFQILFLFQVYYASLRQFPAQCDCQCTKQLHISTGSNNHRADEQVKALEIVDSGEIYETVNSEAKLKMVLNAEDKKLDKAFHHRNSSIPKQDVEEKDPYNQERDEVGGAKSNEPPSGDQPSTFEKLVFQELELNPEVNDSRSRCAGPHSDLILIYVYSSPDHFDVRSRVRRTWGSVSEFMGKQLRVVFFIGALKPETQTHYPKIIEESRSYGDLVQDLSYIDAYRNLTLKGGSALQWVNKYCPNTYRVVKVDDDTLLNPFQLIKFLSGQSQITMSELICKGTDHVGPIRNKQSKYFVSRTEYPSNTYPAYCQGYGYIIPPSLIPKLLEKMRDLRPIAMEDVFFTGMTRHAIDARMHYLTAMFATTFNKFEVFLERISYRAELFLIGHVHEDRSADVFWTLAQQRSKSIKSKKNTAD